MAKIINTKVSKNADFKIEDGVIRDSSIGDWSKVHIHDMSELKDVKIYGDVDVEHSTLEIGVYEKSGRGSSYHFCFYHNNTFAKSWFCRIPFSLLR